MSLKTSQNSILSYTDITLAQQDAIARLYEFDCLLIAKKGFGKALIAQTAAQELLAAGEVSRVLVLAPLKVCQLTWANEWQKWDHLAPVGVALGGPVERELALCGESPIVVLNFENVLWAAKKGLLDSFDGLVIDEISKCKSAGGVVVKALRKRLGQFKWRVGMSATPVAEAGVDIYAQALLIDGGAALGRSLDRFKRNYFYPTDFNQYNWALLPGGGERLAAALADIVYLADDEKYEAGLPELRDTVVPVVMPPDAVAAYDELCDELALEALNVEAVNAATLTGKLQQITAGAVYSGKGARRRTHWLHTAKFDMLEWLLANTRGPVAVAYWFEFELEELRRRYPDMAVLGDDPAGVEAAWNRGDIALMAVHPRSAGHGLNLQFGGHQLIVLTVPWGADPWDQLIGRFRRRGQHSRIVRRTSLIVEDTVDRLVLDRHLRKVYDEGVLMDHLAAVAQKH